MEGKITLLNVKPTVGFTLPWAGVTPAPSIKKDLSDGFYSKVQRRARAADGQCQPRAARQAAALGRRDPVRRASLRCASAEIRRAGRGRSAMVRAEARGWSAHQRMVLVLGGRSAAGARPVHQDERSALPRICARDRRLHGKFGGANSRRRFRAASAGARSVDRRLLLHRARTRAARPNFGRRCDARACGGSDDRASRSSDRF